MFSCEKGRERWTHNKLEKEKERETRAETLSDMLEILQGTSCYGNRKGSRAHVGGVTMATTLGGQVMLKGRAWLMRALKILKFMGMMAGSEEEDKKQLGDKHGTVTLFHAVCL